MRGLGDTLIGEWSYSCGEYVKKIPVVGGEEKRTWGTGRTVKGEGLNIDIDFFRGFSIGRGQWQRAISRHPALFVVGIHEGYWQFAS
jgi:hypothetical protein